jgi:hypothetical protein
MLGLDGVAGITFNDASVQPVAGWTPLRPQSGGVIQTQTLNYSSYSAATASASYTDTGLTISITPKFSTSKILIIVAINGVSTNSTSSGIVNFILTDGSNNTINNITSAGQQSNSSTLYSSIASIYTHSPATTSSLTYKIRAAGSAQGWVVNNYNGSAIVSSSIIVMEIAA